MTPKDNSAYPDWLNAWSDLWQKRLPRGDRPFGLLTKEDSYSGWELDALPVSLDSSPDSLGVVKDVLTALTKAQALDDVKVELGIKANFSNLKDRLMVIDAGNFLQAPYDPEAPPNKRLDFLLGAAVHEWLHFECTDPIICEEVSTQADPILKAIWNVVEDEYIEGVLHSLAPGWGELVWRMRKYLYEDGFPHLDEDKRDTLFSHFLLLVRYPKLLTENWDRVEVHSDELLAISRILTPYPSTPQEVVDASRKIRRVFQDSEKYNDGEDSRFGFQTDIFGDALEAEAGSGLGPLDYPHQSGRKGKVVWHNVESNKASYAVELWAVKPHVTKLRQWLARFFYEPQAAANIGAREGYVDSRKLHRVFTDRHVFARRERSLPRKIDVALLCDQSGSMKGDKMRAARRIAIVFLEALMPLEEFVTLHIYGHTADIRKAISSTDIYRYWSPTWRRRYSLGNMQAKSNNADSEALLAVARDLGRTAENDTVLISISDSNPHADHLSGEPAVSSLKAAVRKVEGEGIRVIGVGIDPAVQMERLYTNFVNFTDLDSLPSQMSSLLRKVVSSSGLA